MSRNSSTERRRSPNRHPDRAIFALDLFDSFGEARAFERRGGIAGRGRGSSPHSHSSRESSSEANDSGYFSTIMHEDSDTEDDGIFSPPLSPKTRVPPRVRRTTQRKQRDRPALKRKESWKPNLKADSIFEHGLHGHIRSDSIDTLIKPEVAAQTRESRRKSTLLHPSSPTIEAVSFQTIQAFPQARVVHIHRSTTSLVTKEDDTITTITASRPSMPPRKGSSLLHPSCPTSETSLSQFKTIISVPPQKSRTPSPPSVPASRSSSTTSSERETPTPAYIPTTLLPVKAQHIAIRTSPSRVRQRQQSVIHSCLSESEDDGRSAADGGARSFRGHLAEAAENAIFARIDRKARVSGRRTKTV